MSIKIVKSVLLILFISISLSSCVRKPSRTGRLPPVLPVAADSLQNRPVVAGNSAYSNDVSATTNNVVPVAPTNLRAIAGSSSQIILNWTVTNTNQSGFKIERKRLRATLAIASGGDSLSSVPIYRQFNAAIPDHLFTQASTPEVSPYQMELNGLPSFWVYSTPTSACTTHLFRCYNGGRHYISTRSNCSDDNYCNVRTPPRSCIRNATTENGGGPIDPRSGKQSLGIACQSQNQGTSRLYRMDNRKTNNHVYTRNWNEIQWWNSQPHSGWVYDNQFVAYVGTSATSLPIATDYTEVGSVGPNNTSFTDNALTPATRYSYRVLSYNATGNSAYSNQVDTQTPPLDPPPGKRVGILYLVSNSFAWRHLSSPGSRPILSVQDILMNPARILFGTSPQEIFDQRNETYHITQTNPVDENGHSDLYCFFDGAFEAPAGFNRHSGDKPRRTCDPVKMLSVVRRHMSQLKDMGVDFLIIDNSNAFSSPGDYTTEVVSFRAIEVFFEKWKFVFDENRAVDPAYQGPKLTVWSPIPAGSNYYLRMLDNLYNKPEYDSIIFKHAGGVHNGKKVFFYVDPAYDPQDARNPDTTIKHSIARNNIIPVPMWTHFGKNGFESTNMERWDFISPCLKSVGSTYIGTSSVTNRSCNQWVSSSTIGKVVSVAPSYQVPGAFASQPFGAPGRLGGLTLQKQFDTVFQVSPDYIVVASWNEHATGPQYRPDLGPPIGYGDRSFPISIGNENQERLSGLAYSQYSHYVDDYAAEFSKDIEPTKEYGTRMLDLTKELISLYKSGASICPQTNPYCVKKEYYVPVWTLHNSKGRYAYGTDLNEKGILMGAAMGENRYTEVCAKIADGIQSDFCSNPAEPHAYSGPFIAYNASRPSNDGTTRPVYRCYNSASLSYFYTLNSSECRAAGVYSMDPNRPLFYVSIHKTPEMMRALRRCYGSSNFIAVDVARCPAASGDEGFMGYVH